LPLVLYGLCLSPLLPAVGSGTVAQIAQDKLLDGVSLYMTFRQFGASLGVALLNILLSHRETLHSSRLFEHLHRSDGGAVTSLASRSANAVAHGYSSIDAQRLALGQLAEVGKQQAATLSYADAFGFMAVIGIIVLCLIPIMPPTPVIRK
jgi:DHA2 family multidrug resistance protein